MFKKIILLSLLFFSCLFFPLRVKSEETVDNLSRQINEYTQKLQELSKAKNTLANQIKILNSQVELTLLKINQTENSIKILEEEINSLTIEIGKLDVQLNELSTLYVLQIIQNYKLQKKVPPFAFLISSSLNNFLEQHKYISNIQKNSQNSLINMETIRTNYDIQKNAKAKKQSEMEQLQKTLASQKDSLAKQRQDKVYLLEITKNDEKNYEKLKKAAEEELNALLKAKFVGKRQVAKGEALGTMGNTGFSTGAHLHFGLYDLKESEISSWTYVRDLDPRPYISQHRWPMNGDIRITQERGVTFFSKNYSDNFHHGIDMVSNIKTIVAVNEGVAYFYRNPTSSLGNHVKLFHPDGKMTLYLHME